MGAEASVGGAGVPHQPVGAHEGNELSKRGHDAQQGPQHGAAGDDDMAHGCRRREAVPLSTLLGWMAHSPSGGGGGGGPSLVQTGARVNTSAGPQRSINHGCFPLFPLCFLSPARVTSPQLLLLLRQLAVLLLFRSCVFLFCLVLLSTSY